MDDDDVQDTSIAATPTKPTAAATKPAAPEGQAPASQVAPAETEVLPAKPPRPMSEAQQNEAMLKEAFPTVEANVIKAILRASGGQVEPAFNALLGKLT